ncbi:hypothetical protein ACFL35_07340 [Candidatus Riflebacteria bacterium]
MREIWNYSLNRAPIKNLPAPIRVMGPRLNQAECRGNKVFIFGLAEIKNQKKIYHYIDTAEDPQRKYYEYIYEAFREDGEYYNSVFFTWLREQIVNEKPPQVVIFEDIIKHKMDPLLPKIRKYKMIKELSKEHELKNPM